MREVFELFGLRSWGDLVDLAGTVLALLLVLATAGFGVLVLGVLVGAL